MGEAEGLIGFAVRTGRLLKVGNISEFVSLGGALLKGWCEDWRAMIDTPEDLRWWGEAAIGAAMDEWGTAASQINYVVYGQDTQVWER